MHDVLFNLPMDKDSADMLQLYMSNKERGLIDDGNSKQEIRNELNRIKLRVMNALYKGDNTVDIDVDTMISALNGMDRTNPFKYMLSNTAALYRAERIDMIVLMDDYKLLGKLFKLIFLVLYLPAYLYLLSGINGSNLYTGYEFSFVLIALMIAWILLIKWIIITPILLETRPEYHSISISTGWVELIMIIYYIVSAIIADNFFETNGFVPVLGILVAIFFGSGLVTYIIYRGRKKKLKIIEAGEGMPMDEMVFAGDEE
jgi:hypothetical protein